MVVECKRVRDVDWLFLVDRDHNKARRNCKAWLSRYADGTQHLSSWYDIAIGPPSPAAAFCQVRGQSEGARPMLERTTSEVLMATESVARQERAPMP
jgi:hypothetical protein